MEARILNEGEGYLVFYGFAYEHEKWFRDYKQAEAFVNKLQVQQ